MLGKAKMDPETPWPTSKAGDKDFDPVVSPTCVYWILLYARLCARLGEETKAHVVQ